MDERMETAIKNLERNHIKVYYVETSDAVVPLVRKLLSDGDIVSVGGSESLFEAGVIDLLRNGHYRFLDRYAPGLTKGQIEKIYYETMSCDVYFCSANAVTEAGELYNVDGNANRISAIAYGPKSVIMVVGKNKLVPDLETAIRRVKTAVAPEICARRGRNTYCAKIGHCVSLSGSMTSGCDSFERTCCSYLVTGYQRIKERIKVVFVGERLGI